MTMVWRYLFLTLTAFTGGFLHSAFHLDLLEYWQIPFVVGLAALFALAGPRRTVPALTKSARTKEEPVFPPRLNLDMLESASPSENEKATAPAAIVSILGSRLPEVARGKREGSSTEFRVWYIDDRGTEAADLQRFFAAISGVLAGDLKPRFLVTSENKTRIKSLAREPLNADLQDKVVFATLDPFASKYPFQHQFDLIVCKSLFADLELSVRVPLLRRLAKCLSTTGLLLTDERGARFLRASRWERLASGIFKLAEPSAPSSPPAANARESDAENLA